MPFIGGSRYSQIRWPGMADFILDKSATDVMLLLPSIEASSLQGNFGGAGMNVDDSLGNRIGREWDGAKVNDPIGSMRYGVNRNGSEIIRIYQVLEGDRRLLRVEGVVIDGVPHCPEVGLQGGLFGERMYLVDVVPLTNSQDCDN